MPHFQIVPGDKLLEEREVQIRINVLKVELEDLGRKREESAEWEKTTQASARKLLDTINREAEALQKNALGKVELELKERNEELQGMGKTLAILQENVKDEEKRLETLKKNALSEDEQISALMKNKRLELDGLMKEVSELEPTAARLRDEVAESNTVIDERLDEIHVLPRN